MRLFSWLKAFEQLTIVWLCSYSDTEYTCYPSIGTLAREMNVSRTTVIRYLKALEHKWIIKKEKRYKWNEQQSCLYSLIIPEDIKQVGNITQTPPPVSGEYRSSIQKTYRTKSNELNFNNPIRKPPDKSVKDNDISITVGTSESCVIQTLEQLDELVIKWAITKTSITYKICELIVSLPGIRLLSKFEWTYISQVLPVYFKSKVDKHASKWLTKEMLLELSERAIRWNYDKDKEIKSLTSIIDVFIENEFKKRTT